MNENQFQFEIEYLARAILRGQVDHEQWTFAFGDWANDGEYPTLSAVLHRWNNNTTIPDDEKYFETIVYDAMDAACIFLTEKPLFEAFGHLTYISGWVKDFSGSLLRVNLS